jgi:hypothetical protein
MTDQWLERVNRALRQYDMGLLDVRGVAEVLIPEPPTDDEREALIEQATWALVEWDTDTADRGVRDEHYRERRADVERVFPILARNRGRGPITDEAVDAACEAWASEPVTIPGEGALLAGRRYMHAALEAARNAEAGR